MWHLVYLWHEVHTELFVFPLLSTPEKPSFQPELTKHVVSYYISWAYRVTIHNVYYLVFAIPIWRFQPRYEEFAYSLLDVLELPVVPLPPVFLELLEYPKAVSADSRHFFWIKTAYFFLGKFLGVDFELRAVAWI